MEAKTISRVVKSAFIHQPLQWAGVAGSERTLNSTKIPGLKMRWESDGLYLEAKGQFAMVPAANVATLVFEK
jgi:hypothetical protein